MNSRRERKTSNRKIQIWAKKKSDTVVVCACFQLQSRMNKELLKEEKSTRLYTGSWLLLEKKQKKNIKSFPGKKKVIDPWLVVVGVCNM
jgi:hypothetical protein